MRNISTYRQFYPYGGTPLRIVCSFRLLLQRRLHVVADCVYLRRRYAVFFSVLWRRARVSPLSNPPLRPLVQRQQIMSDRVAVKASCLGLCEQKQYSDSSFLKKLSSACAFRASTHSKNADLASRCKKRCSESATKLRRSWAGSGPPAHGESARSTRNYRRQGDSWTSS